MAKTIGRVVEIKNDGWAMVVAESGQGCGGCNAVSHCHAGRTAMARQTTAALNPIDARVGDQVVLSLASGTLLSRLALLYLLPVALMLIGAFWGAGLDGGGSANGYSVAYGLAGFISGFVISVAISRIWSRLRPVTPTISRIASRHFQSTFSSPPAGCGCPQR